MTTLMSVDRYYMTVIILAKFAQIQLVHIIVVVLLDSQVFHVLMSMSAIANFTTVIKKRVFVTILLVRSLVNVIKDMSVTAKTVLTSMNALTEISMIVITTPDVLTLKVHMNANVMLVSDQGNI